MRRYSLFGGLSDATLAIIRERMQIHEYREGAYVFRQGDPGNHVGFVLQGQVHVELDGEDLGALGEGEQFGEMHLIEIMPRSADVIADTDVSIAEITNQDLFDVRRQNPDAFLVLMMNCARDISRRLRIMNKRYVTLLARQRESRAGG